MNERKIIENLNYALDLLKQSGQKHNEITDNLSETIDALESRWSDKLRVQDNEEKEESC